MREICIKAKKEANYTATRYLHILNDHGSLKIATNSYKFLKSIRASLFSESNALLLPKVEQCQFPVLKHCYFPFTPCFGFVCADPKIIS